MNIPIENLTTKGFVSISYPPDLRRAVLKTVASWKDFCALPETLKKSLPYSNTADGVGYELKEGVGNKADRKENFDATTGGKKWLDDHIGMVKNPIMLRYIEDVTALVSIMKPLILDFSSMVEKTFCINGLVKEVDESEGAYFIRFIHYFGDRVPGDEIASAHVDQSAISLHLYESSPGFQVLMPEAKRERQWVNAPISTDQTVIIPSMQMQLRSSGRLTAICHRAVATKDTADRGRYSAVCFVQLKNTPKYDKASWGRLQEMQPGFNYGLSQGEFKKYFKG